MAKPIETPIKSLDELKSLVKEHCSQAMKNPVKIYRGSPSYDEKYEMNYGAVIDATKATGRVSANTSNWYTMFLDSNPAMHQFPKRSGSLICSTDMHKAENYGDNIFLILPFDNTPIGACGKSDIFHIPISLFGKKIEMYEGNWDWDYFQQILSKNHKINISDIDITTLFKLDILLTKQDILHSLVKAIFPKITENQLTNFMDSIFEIYGPHLFKLRTPETVELSDGEVWLQGKSILINSDLYKFLK